MSRSRTARSVAFARRAPGAKRVPLAGTLYDWSADAVPMRKDAKGIRSASLKLEPGRYECRFVVGGEWCARAADASVPASSHCVADAFGTENRVLEVE